MKAIETMDQGELIAEVERLLERVTALVTERDGWAAHVAAVTDALIRIEGEYGCQCDPSCPKDGDEACVSAIAGDALRHFGGRAEALLHERGDMRDALQRIGRAVDKADERHEARCAFIRGILRGLATDA